MSDLTLIVIGLMLGPGDPSPGLAEINFDNITVDDIDFVDPDTFANLGLVADAAFAVQDLESMAPSWWWDGFLVPGGVTAPNVLPLQNSVGLDVTFTFLTPAGCPGLIEYFEVRGFDSEQGSILGLVETYNLDGDLLNAQQRLTPANRTDLFVLAGGDVASVRISTDSDGASFDNVVFSTPTLAITPDLNRDGVVDSDDLGMLIMEWGACAPETCCLEDLNRDGQVNASDLARLLASWG